MSLEYIKLATSKDKTRFNFNQVYRDLNKIVATDGHRMHWINGQEEIAKGFYLDGQDHGPFPDYSQVFPKADPASLLSVVLTTDFVKKAKAMLKLIQCYTGKEAPIRLNCFHEVVENKPTMTVFELAFTDSKNLAKFSIQHKTSEDALTGPAFTTMLNLSYLIDAIELPIKDNYISAINLKYYERMQPVLIETRLGNALIMPMKD